MADAEIDDFARDLGGRMVINKVCDLMTLPLKFENPHWAYRSHQIDQILSRYDKVCILALRHSRVWLTPFECCAQDDDKLLTKRKRGGDQEFGSEDSDDGFGRGAPGGKAVRFAKSTAGSVGGRSRVSGATARTFGGKSAASTSSKRSAATAKGSHHSGNR